MIRSAIIAVPLCLIAAPALAQKEPPKRPEAFEKLINCRAIADSTARLACYEAQVERLDTAEKNSEVVVLDKAEVRKARRGLFGFTVPDLGIFGGRKSEAEDNEEITQIESTIKWAGINRVGKWTFIIEDGARWVQTDTADIRIPKVGMKIRIREAAMGSYFANINDRPGIRVRRGN